MEPYTLDREFRKQDIIDRFHSFIWTERYYGDGQVEIVVPKTSEMITKLPVGTFLGVAESEEIMILETRNFDDDKMKLSGISLALWLNNRFIRSSARHEDRYWYLGGHSVGETLWLIVYNMCVEGSPYLDGTIDIGIVNPEQFAVPGLELDSFDSSGDNINVGIPFGPVYDALREIASTFKVGVKVTLEEVNAEPFVLKFKSYKGLDRTGLQEVNSVIRFSADLDTFANIKELQSIALQKTIAYAFAPANPDGLAVAPGQSSIVSAPTGFDLRALLVFAEDITTDMVEGDATNLVRILNSRADEAISVNHFIKTIDGEIVPDNILRYGEDYNLGDIIEVQGHTGLVQTARVTEYIRSQDPTGEKSYPTITMLGDEVVGPRPPNDDWENAHVLNCDLPTPIVSPEPLFVRYVDFDDGNDSNDGLTEETAWLTIHGGTNHNPTSGQYFHSAENGDIPQFGPGYTYRLRGSAGRCFFIKSTLFAGLAGTAEAPCVFESWDNESDRASIGVSGVSYSIKTGSSGSPDDHHVIFRGLDIYTDTDVNSNYVTFENIHVVMSNLDDNFTWAILCYGDYNIIDRCLIDCRVSTTSVYLVGGYNKIMNSIFRGLNYEGTPVDREGTGDQNEGPTIPWIIELDPENSDELPLFTFVNNTVIGMGGAGVIFDKMGDLYPQLDFGIVADGLIYENNIFADIMTQEGDVGFWNLSPDFASISIKNNLFANDVIGFSEESFYLNIDNSFGGPFENITFDPTTDIFANPEFVDQLTRDLRLKNISPAIDAGSPDNAPDHDYRNFPRSNILDMGVMEFSNFVRVGTNRFATSQDIDIDFPLGSATSVWYRLVPSADIELTIWVEGRGKGPIVDPQLMILEYINPVFTLIDETDSPPLVVNLLADHIYYVNVDVTPVEHAGDFNIKWGYVPSA